MALVIVLAGGGTAGHVVPALALAEAIQKADPETQIRFVGTKDGQEERLVPAAGYTLDVVPSRPVLGRSPLAMLGALFTLVRGIGVARRLLGEIGADLVIGVGGFASVPAVMAAVLRGIPTALIEPNAKPGRANRLLGRFAGIVCVQFEDARAYFPAGRAERLGFPVRDIPRSNGRRDRDALRLLVMGGSQGARAINRAVTGRLAHLRDVTGLRITHQTGVHDLDEVKAAYAEAGVEAEIAAFYEDMPARLATADLVIARAGASTIAEICAAGVASVLVPLPLADDHQLANASELRRAGGCALVPNDLAASELVGEVVRLLSDSEARQRMADVSGTRAQPDAAARIWRACRALVRRGDAS